jgi:coenzyme F420-reducing hydrogenase delta subunit
VADLRLVVYACRRLTDELPDAVSLPCAGRLGPGTILEAFAGGADGVAAAPCGDERHGCRFETGMRRAEHAVLVARRVLGRLGLAAERVAVVRSPGELAEFRDALERMPPTGLSGSWRPDGAHGLNRCMAAVAALTAEERLVPRRADGRPGMPGRGAETVLWEGCTPFAELLLEEPLGGAREGDGLQVLQAAGVRAGVLPDERCCGLPWLAAGRSDLFRAVAQRNAERLRESGARRVVARCSSCAQVLAEEYPRAGASFPAEVQLLGEALAAAGFHPRLGPALRLTDCTARGEQAAGKVLANLRTTGSTPALHEPAGWLGGTAQRRAADLVLRALARRKISDVVASCPRCALALRLLARPGSWRPRQVRVLGLGDLVPGGTGSGR